MEWIIGGFLVGLLGTVVYWAGSRLVKHIDQQFRNTFDWIDARDFDINDEGIDDHVRNQL